MDACIAVAAVFLFWTLRSSMYAGDGLLIARITEGGKWLVNNELLAQAILQLAFRVGSGFGADIHTVMNAVSCVCGGMALMVLLACARAVGVSTPFWPLLLFASGGFFVYACGHTEYYPMLLPAFWFYCLLGVGYSAGQVSLAWVCGAFWLMCALHFGSLFALPSLLVLVWKRSEAGWIKPLVVLALGIAFLFLLRNGLGLVGYRVAGLGPGVNLLPLFPSDDMNRYYAFFQWGHLYDWVYGWTMRSWVLWPIIGMSLWWQGAQSILRPDRLFLLVCTLGFTCFSVIWHPDLGIPNDWDLFALESVPCMLLALSFLPGWTPSMPRCFILTAAACVGAILMMTHVMWMHTAQSLDHGRVVMIDAFGDEASWIIDGAYQQNRDSLHQAGVRPFVWIDRAGNRSVNGFVVVLRDTETAVNME